MTLPPTLDPPKVLQLWQWITEPLKYLDNYNRQCGDIFTIKMSGALNQAVFIANPQTIQQVLTNDTKQFSAPGSINQILQPFLGDRGVILLDGQEHRQRRQLLMPQFHGDKIRGYTELICATARSVVTQWQVGQTVNIRAEMQSISLDVILQTVFGLDRGERYDLIREGLVKVGSLIESPINASFLLIPALQQDLGAWSPWGRFLRDRAALDRLLYQEIADRRRDYQSEKTDILTLLIGAKDAEGNGMSDLELHDELMTLLFAGHETTATALAWAIYWINYLPAVKTKLLAEIETLGTDRDPIAISRLPYLNAVCAETLRIYPVGDVDISPRHPGASDAARIRTSCSNRSRRLYLSHTSSRRSLSRTRSIQAGAIFRASIFTLRTFTFWSRKSSLHGHGTGTIRIETSFG
jgi:cytochrome P450 family 110